jgi:hypothetical protein
MLALAGATHTYAQATTTTSASTNSTTTTGGGCAPDDRTLAGIDCRLAAFRQTVFDADASLGRLFDPIRFRLQNSARGLTRAHAFCRDADENRARQQLQRCVRPVAMALAKIRSTYGRRIIPPDLGAALASEANGLASDLMAARKSLTPAPRTARV